MHIIGTAVPPDYSRKVEGHSDFRHARR